VEQALADQAPEIVAHLAAGVGREAGGPVGPGQGQSGLPAPEELPDRPVIEPVRQGLEAVGIGARADAIV
jgi:hypothetical protein